MKSLSLLAGGVFLLTATALFSAPPPATRTPPRQATDAQWNVRVEVLMVAMPQDKLLPLLPDLRDPKKIDAAVAHLLEAVQRKEAILTGYPVVSILDGQRGVSETIAEKRYPASFESPRDPPPPGAPVPRPAGSQTVIDSPEPAPPGEFETRNCGVTLEVEPHVSSRGDFIRLYVIPQRVELLGVDTFGAVKAAGGQIVKIDQPQFFSTKTTTTLTVPNGQQILIAVHLLPKPENYVEVFVLSASATPIQ